MSANALTPVVGTGLPVTPVGPRREARLWRWFWPKLMALAIALAVWQLSYWVLVSWTGHFKEYLYPAPVTTLDTFWHMVTTNQFWGYVVVTVKRALIGFCLALVIGTLVGLIVSRSQALRAGAGSLITALQTMPSIVWFPFAIMLLGTTEATITLVIVLGAAPSIANGVLSGIDHIPPSFLRLGQVLGARGFSLYRYIVAPAIMPSYVSGLNQGWAFSWRSLMAGELLFLIAGHVGLGNSLNGARNVLDMAKVEAIMIAILIIGMVASGVFSSCAEVLRRRRGLVA
jgi:NitT/TauT family transport system permease protein